LKWLRSPTPESAILLAVAFRANPIDALAAAGFLSDGDTLVSEPDPELEAIPSVRLTAELYRRARAEDHKRLQANLDPFAGDRK
jgi:hypothetical protein